VQRAGQKAGVIADDFLDMSKSLNEGAVQVPVFASWEARAYAASGFFNNDTKLSNFTPEEMNLLLYGKTTYKLRIGDGTLNAKYKLNGKSISDVLALTVAQALAFFTQREVVRKLRAMSDVAGLPHPWPATEHAVSWRMPAHQAGQRAPEIRQHLRARRADDLSAQVRSHPPAGHLEPPRRRRQLGHRHRAQPERHPQGRLGYRPGPRRLHQGSRVIFEGTPMALLESTQSLTAQYLRPHYAAATTSNSSISSRQ
jgi:hypothetical protein